MRSLELVELVDRKGEFFDGLVSVHKPGSGETDHEHAILLQASAFEHIDHVFFRRFKNAQGKHVRSSQVAAYVVDNSQHQLSEGELASLHHKLWLHGVAPLVYVAWPTRIDILSCAREPDFWDVSANGGTVRYRHAARIEPPQAIKTAGKITKEFERLRSRFSAYRLAEGTFWDDPDNQKLAKAEAAAHRSLIQAIVGADLNLNGTDHPIRRRLLVLTVLVQYLEDREVFPPELFGRFHAGSRTFREILRKGTVKEVRSLLRHLENKFNGDVFSLGDDGEALTEGELKAFADLVEAKSLGGQRYFWELFSFEHIPVEVISRLYQRFVTGHGTVYTPPFLASLLLDQVMPYEGMTGKEKVLDPACGSGVFLVGALKRLVIHWRSGHRWRKPTVDDLRRILAHSIYGVELEAGAVDLTAFSLALAVCDALEPPVIWSSLKFDKLRGCNLREGDFFDPTTFTNRAGHDWPEKFDVVIGNPPFESELTPAAKAVDAGRPKEQPRLPDKQAAYLFLEKGLRLLSVGGSLCLIQPHGLLYNSNPTEFRRHLMSLCRLHTVLDFVSMRGMYEGADPKTIAWYALQELPDDQPVNHLTFRRTYAASERIVFEIDHYDWHVLSQQQASENPFVWRVGLLGGGRLLDVSRRLLRITTLEILVAKKKWVYGEGFTVGNRAKLATFLTNLPLLPTSALTSEGIDEDQLTKVLETHFEAPRHADLYAAPLVLMKEHESLPSAFWEKGPLAFGHKIVGIHAPIKDRKALFEVYRLLGIRHRLYKFCCVLNGTQALVGKATAVQKQDIDRLPFPDDPSELAFCFWEDVLKEDVLDYMTDYVRLGQNSDMLKQSATASDVAEYSALYVRLLGSLYPKLKAHEPVPLNGLIAQPFFFGSRPDVSWLGRDCEKWLQSLIYDTSRDSLRTVRVVRYYDANVVLIVKPDRLRYWIRSTAIRDADDTLIDLRGQGW